MFGADADVVLGASSGQRASYLRVGERVNTNNGNVSGRLRMTSGGSFTGYVAVVRVGYNPNFYYNDGRGTLDLRTVSNGVFDVSSELTAGRGARGTGDISLGTNWTVRLGKDSATRMSTLAIGYTLLNNNSSEATWGRLRMVNGTFSAFVNNFYLGAAFNVYPAPTLIGSMRGTLDVAGVTGGTLDVATDFYAGCGNYAVTALTLSSGWTFTMNGAVGSDVLSVGYARVGANGTIDFGSNADVTIGANSGSRVGTVRIGERVNGNVSWHTVRGKVRMGTGRFEGHIDNLRVGFNQNQKYTGDAYGTLDLGNATNKTLQTRSTLYLGYGHNAYGNVVLGANANLIFGQDAGNRMSNVTIGKAFDCNNQHRTGWGKIAQSSGTFEGYVNTMVVGHNDNTTTWGYAYGTVDLAGATMTNGGFEVTSLTIGYGYYGRGYVALPEGGTVTAGSVSIGGAHKGCYGRLRVNGSFMRVNGALAVNANGRLDLFNAGTLIVNGPFTGSAGTFDWAAGTTLGGYGSTDFTIDNADKTVAPGDPTGTLEVSGNYAQGADGAFHIEVAGEDEVITYSALIATGTVTVDGSLSVWVDELSKPPPSAELVILEGVSRTGQFDNAPPGCSFVTSDGNWICTVTYTETAVVLTRFRTKGLIIILR